MPSDLPPVLPSVSIVVLNWNGKQHLQSCLDSLLALDYPKSELEIILCDNGSSDGSVDFVKERFNSVRVIALDRNYGFAEGNNRAARVVAGEWVAFLNNDMRVEPSWIKDMLSATAEHPDAVCLSSRILGWDGSVIDFAGGGVNYQGHGFQIDIGKPPSKSDASRRLLFACGGAMLIKKDIFLDVGGFDEQFFAFFEDVDLGWRLNLLGYDVWYVPRATALHRHHGTAGRIDSHKLQVLYERNALAMIYKCFDDKNLAAALPAALLLLNERALLQSGLDRGKFVVGAAGSPPATAAGSPAASSTFAKGRKALDQKGVGVTASHAAGWALARVAAFVLATRNRFRPSLVIVPGVTMSHYLGESEFAQLLESLGKKRAWIQERRKRTDIEILPLFVDPLQAQYADERYLKFYSLINRTFGLDKRFSATPQKEVSGRR